jgi:hypothetical protein
MATRRSMVGRRTQQPAPRRPRRSIPQRSTPRRPARRRPRGPSGPPLLRLILIPVALTLGVTLLRLAGELMEWSPLYFSRVAGGGLAVVGITWLVPILGFYFGYRLGRAGVSPSSVARAAGLPLAGLVLWPALGWLGSRLESASTATGLITVWAASSVAAAVLAVAAWPTLGRVLLVYAFAARLPVAGIMWPAIHRRWGTHYDAPPPGLPAMTPEVRWLWTGLVPQMTIWVAWTVAVGGLFGALGWLVAARQAR